MAALGAKIQSQKKKYMWTVLIRMQRGKYLRHCRNHSSHWFLMTIWTKNGLSWLRILRRMVVLWISDNYWNYISMDSWFVSIDSRFIEVYFTIRWCIRPLLRTKRSIYHASKIQIIWPKQFQWNIQSEAVPYQLWYWYCWIWFHAGKLILTRSHFAYSLYAWKQNFPTSHTYPSSVCQHKCVQSWTILPYLHT